MPVLPSCAKSLCEKKVFRVYWCGIFLTVGQLGTYSVTMWEKVANCGFLKFAAAKISGGYKAGIDRQAG